MAAHESKRKYERPGRVDLHQHYSEFRSRILPTLNLVKYYVNDPSSFVCCSMLWFNIDNRYFSIRTGHGATHGSSLNGGRNKYFNIHYTIDVLGFDLSFKYRYYTNR